MDDFTLVIPTYNRPQQLSGLLGYLEAERPGFRVLVLDSSRPEVLARNRERTAGPPSTSNMRSSRRRRVPSTSSVPGRTR